MIEEHLHKQALSWAGLAGSLMGAIEGALIDLKHDDHNRAIERLSEILQRARQHSGQQS